MIYAALVAGGTGTRMGGNVPKQFLELGDRPVLLHTIMSFLALDEIDLVYVGVHADWYENLSYLCAAHMLDMSRIRIVEGGADRTDTVFEIMCMIEQDNGISDDDIIITHDGVRPFVSVREILESVVAMNDQDAVTVCLPSTDTLIFSEGGSQIDKVPDRSKMFRALTPQTFKLRKLRDAYASLPDEYRFGLTDTASIFITAGLPVGLIRGNERNIKLTTPTDMTIAEQLLKEDNHD